MGQQGIQAGGSDNIDAVREARHKSGSTARGTWERKGSVEPRNSRLCYYRTVVLNRKCAKCDKVNHSGGICPAIRSNCKKVRRKGHWEKCCVKANKVSKIETCTRLTDNLYLG